MSLRTVLTLGPASVNEAIMRALRPAADRFRLNTSHLDPQTLREWLHLLRQVFGAPPSQPPLVLDLQGAKMRIGRYPACAEIPAQVRLIPAAESSDPALIPVPHEALFSQVREGETLTLNDARIRLRIEKIAGDHLSARVLRNGPLSSKKGINRPDHPLRIDALTARDAEMIALSHHLPWVEYAFSFVATGDEAQLLRSAAPGRRLIAKIELPAAFPHLAEIDAGFDEIWLCRGDLGAQAGFDMLGSLQARFAARIPSFEHPALLAGQVLEHLTHHPTPTRSEIVHLHDIARAGFGGVVLSDETAIGDHPRAVARWLQILRTTDQSGGSPPISPLPC
jgi:pyruvate kinase